MPLRVGRNASPQGPPECPLTESDRAHQLQPSRVYWQTSSERNAIAGARTKAAGDAWRCLLLALKGTKSVPAHQSIAFRFLQICLHHFPDKFFKSDARPPAETIPGMRRIS